MISENFLIFDSISAITKASETRKTLYFSEVVETDASVFEDRILLHKQSGKRIYLLPKSPLSVVRVMAIEVLTDLLNMDTEIPPIVVSDLELLGRSKFYIYDEANEMWLPTETFIFLCNLTSRDKTCRMIGLLILAPYMEDRNRVEISPRVFILDVW